MKHRNVKLCGKDLRLLYRCGLFLVFGLLSISLYAQSTSASNTEMQRKGQEYFEKGIDALKNGQSTNAVAFFSLSLRFDNRNYQTYYNLGLAKQNLGQIDDAIRNYSYGLELSTGEDQAQVFSSRGTAYYANQDYDKAIEDYNRGLALNPESESMYSNRGLALSAQGKNAQAVWDFSTALVLDPGYGTAHIGRGIAYYNMGDLPEALSDYSAALEYNPDDVITLFNRALLYRDQANYDLGINDLNAAIDLLNTNPNIARDANLDLVELRNKCEVALKELRRKKESSNRYSDLSTPPSIN